MGAREKLALFNMLAPYLEGARLLPVLAFHPDLAAGHAAEGRAVIQIRLVYDALEPLCGPFKVP